MKKPLKAVLLSAFVFPGVGHFLIEIIGDVQPSDRVVIRGAERWSTGMMVQSREDDSANGVANSRRTSQ